jgi:hypothetical protein
MIRITMPRQGVLTTNVWTAGALACENSFLGFRPAENDVPRAGPPGESLRAFVSRRPCTTKKETPGEAPGVGLVCALRLHLPCKTSVRARIHPCRNEPLNSLSS